MFDNHSPLMKKLADITPPKVTRTPNPLKALRDSNTIRFGNPPKHSRIGSTGNSLLTREKCWRSCGPLGSFSVGRWKCS